MPARVPEEQPITKDEQSIIDAIKQQLGGKMQQSANVSETTLLRFVRGFKDDANPKQKAIQMVSDMLDWRQREKVDEWGLKENSLPREAEFRSRFWVSGLHGRSRDGHPIYIEKLGSIDPTALTKNFSTDEVQRFHVQLMERITQYKEQLSAETGKRYYKQVVILDLKGVGMGHTGSKFTTPMKSTIHVDQFYYPETLKLMFITNASWVIKTIWKLVSPWIDPITKENIKFGTSELSNFIDQDQLPKFLGGTCKCRECLVTEFIPGDGAKFGPMTPRSRRNSTSLNKQAPSPNNTQQQAAATAPQSSSPSNAQQAAVAAAAVPQSISPNHTQQQQQQASPVASQSSPNHVSQQSAAPATQTRSSEDAQLQQASNDVAGLSLSSQQQQPEPATHNQERFESTIKPAQTTQATQQTQQLDSVQQPVQSTPAAQTIQPVQNGVVDGGYTVMSVPIR